jgi:hypothetical protein
MRMKNILGTLLFLVPILVAPHAKVTPPFLRTVIKAQLQKIRAR